MSADAIAAGKASYTKYCRFCHGDEAKGGGESADTHLRLPPIGGFAALSRRRGSLSSAARAPYIHGPHRSRRLMLNLRFETWSVTFPEEWDHDIALNLSGGSAWLRTARAAGCRS